MAFVRRQMVCYLILALCLTMLSGCATNPQFDCWDYRQQKLAEFRAISDSIKIIPGDRLSISFPSPDGSGICHRALTPVSADGSISLPFNVRIIARDKTPPEVAEEIRQSYTNCFNNLTVVVRLVL